MAGAGKTKRNVLLVALLLGLVTSALTYRFLQKARSEEKLVPVVVTTREVLPRTIIESAMVTTRRVPRVSVPRAAYSAEQDVIGKVALVTLPRDTPVAISDIEERGASLGLSYVIPPFMRAVTVALDPVIGVAGFLKPGDHVDVVATFKAGREVVAKTVLQDVQLLALGPQVEKEPMKENQGKPKPERNTATILVTPEEAERLVLAENEGRLRLVLRAVGDVARIDSKGTTSKTVTGSEIQAARAAADRDTAQHRAIARESAAPPPQVIYTPAPREHAPTTAVRVTARQSQPQKPRGHEIEVIRGTEVKTVEVEVGTNGQ